MSNRFYNQFRLALEKQVVDLYATVEFSGTAQPTLKSWTAPRLGASSAYASATNGFKGITAVSRSAAGVYDFYTSDNFQRVLGASVTWDITPTSTTSASFIAISGSKIQQNGTPGTSAGPYVRIVFSSGSFAQTVATDPVSGTGLFTLTFGNSSAP